MADLFDRLFPGGESAADKIRVHTFMAAITDYIAGHTTRAQIVGAWNLDAEAQADLNALCNHIDGLTGVSNKIVFALELDATMLLAETGKKYATKEAFKSRLGIGA